MSERRAAVESAAIRVRDAVAADLDRVAAIERACFADPWSRNSFATLLRNASVHFRVATTVARPDGARAAASTRGRVAPVTPGSSSTGASDEMGEVVGYVVAWLVVDEAEVANIAVAPEVRGLGVGARLLDDALGAARVSGATAAYLEVRDSNAAARALYASRGFQQVGRRRNYYRKPVEDALVMRRELDPNARDAAAQ